MILRLGAVGVHEGAQLGCRRLGRGLVVDPAGELDAVAAHVHEHSAAGALGIPEPVRMRAEVLLALAHQVHRPQRALVGQLLGPHVLGRKAELLGVHQKHARPAAGRDHLVGLGQRAGKRLLADHVLAGGGGRHRDLTVQVVGGADADDVHVRLLDQRPVVGVVAGNAVRGRKPLGIARGVRRDAAQGGRRHRLERLGVALGDEPRPHQSDSHVAHGVSVSQCKPVLLNRLVGACELASDGDRAPVAVRAYTATCHRPLLRTAGDSTAWRRKLPESVPRKTQFRARDLPRGKLAPDGRVPAHVERRPGAPVTGKVRVFIATSLDGFIAGVGDDLSWLPEGGGEDHGYDEFIAATAAILIGRTTYDVVAGFDSWPYGETPVFVATSRPLDPVVSGVRTVAGEPEEILAAVRAVTDGNVYVDGGVLIRQFMAAGLIDELTVTIVPVVLGAGSPLFAGLPERRRLTLVGSRSYASGLVSLDYVPAA